MFSSIIGFCIRCRKISMVHKNEECTCYNCNQTLSDTLCIKKPLYNCFNCKCGSNWNTPLPILYMACKVCGNCCRSKVLPNDFDNVAKKTFDSLIKKSTNPFEEFLSTIEKASYMGEIFRSINDGYQNDTRINELIEQRNNLSKKLDGLKNDFDYATNRMNELKKDKEVLSTMSSNLKLEHRRILNNISCERDTLKKDLHNSRRERDALKQDLHISRRERDSLEKSLREARCERDIYKNKLNDVTCEKNLIKNDMNEIIGERETYRKSITELEKKLSGIASITDIVEDNKIKKKSKMNNIRIHKIMFKRFYQKNGNMFKCTECDHELKTEDGIRPSQKLKMKIQHCICLRDEEIGEILNFVSSPRIIISLRRTCRRFFYFFESDCVYNKCINVIFKLVSKNVDTIYYATNIHFKYEFILCIDKFPNVTTLDLSCNQLRQEQVRKLKIPESVTTLDLRGNKIGAEGAKNLKLPSRLTTLDLSNNYIGDEGAKNLKIPQSVTYLDLGDNKIGDRGAKCLKIPQSVTYLDLSNNYIDDGNLKLPESLRVLYLTDNYIEPRVEEYLRSRLPNVKLII